MAKKSKTGKNTEAQLLDLLQKVLPKAIEDPALAGKIFEAVVRELKGRARASMFEDFCAQYPLADLETKSVVEVQKELAQAFAGADVAVKPNKKEELLAVEVSLPDGPQFTGKIRVKDAETLAALAAEEADPAAALKYVPFPVCQPGDTELVWFLARKENLTPDEAAIALGEVEAEFWETKTGLKALRKERVEKTFAEFIARAPAGLLTAKGLRRHYKTPEAIKVLRAAARARKS